MGYSKPSMKGKGIYNSRRTKKKIRKSSIYSLPHELLTEILARTAASSFTGLFNAKLSSKIFNQAADDNYVFQKISVKKSPLLSWWRSSNQVAFNSFWERCKRSGNPEALYIQGVVDYFGLERREESGFELLKQAAKLGHNGALYTLAIVLLLSEDDEHRKRGVHIISYLKRSTIRLRENRETLKFIAKRIWLSDQFSRERRRYCTKREKHVFRRSGWESDDEDDIECDACLCEREVASFCGLFPGA